MIKVVNLVAVIIAPIIVQVEDLGIGGWLVVVLLVAGLVWSIWTSKRETPSLKVEPAVASAAD
jgi:K(+)-stimulated pyrophosphate-energized sodium pump